MSELKHTPGEWKITRLDPYCYRLSDNDGIAIGDIFSNSKKVDEIKANVVLAASAPTMLEALQSCLRIKDLWKASENCKPEHEGEMEALNQMEQTIINAITKATKP